MIQQWYYRKGEREQGPMSFEGLKDLVQSGQIVAADSVRPEDVEEWQKVSEVEGLLDPPSDSESDEPPPLAPPQASSPGESPPASENDLDSTEPPPIPPPQASLSDKLPFPSENDADSTEPPPVPPPEASPSDESSLASDEPPPLPAVAPRPSTERDTLTSFLSRSKTFAEKIGTAAKSAGLSAAHQAERTKILKISLPNAYTQLGRLVYSTAALRDTKEFAEIYAQLDAIHARVKQLESGDDCTPPHD